MVNSAITWYNHHVLPCRASENCSIAAAHAYPLWQMRTKAEICPRSPSRPILHPAEGNPQPAEKQIRRSAIQFMPECKNTHWLETKRRLKKKNQRQLDLTDLQFTGVMKEYLDSSYHVHLGTE